MKQDNLIPKNCYIFQLNSCFIYLILLIIQIPWGMPGRAYLTVPPEVEIVPSKMPNAGLGVVSKTFIPKYAWLAEYQRLTVLSQEEAHISAYAWGVSIMNKIEKCTRIKLNKNTFQ